MTINPQDCASDQLYLVKTVDTGDREVYGMRIDTVSDTSWMVLDRTDPVHFDHEVEVIRRADEPKQPWETLREARRLTSCWLSHRPLSVLTEEADRLEAEHIEAEQEKAAANARLAEAVRVFQAAWHEADERGEAGGRTLAGMRALTDAGLLAGLLAEAGDDQ